MFSLTLFGCRYSHLLHAVTLLSLVFYSNSLFADKIKIVFGINKPPFVLEGSAEGLEVDIARAALAKVGHELVAAAVPFERKKTIWEDVPDLSGVAVVSKDAQPGLHYIDQFIYYETYAFTRKKRGLVLNSIADLKGLKIAAFNQAHLYLGDEFYALFNPSNQSSFTENYSELPNDGANAVFWLGHYDVLISDKSIFYWYKNKFSKRMDTTDATAEYSLFGGKTYYPIAFKDKSLADQFEQGLAQLKASGEYDALYQKYLYWEQH